MNKINIFIFLCLLIALTSMTACSLGKRNVEPSEPQNASGTTQPDEAPQTAQPESEPMNENLDYASIDERCKNALENAVEDYGAKYFDKDQTLKACQMLHAFLGNYDKLDFITKPVPPYYFIQAFVEREISPVYVVHAQEGVIPKNSPEAIETFIKHIDILHTTSDAKALARMIYAFHAGDTEDLVTSYQAAEPWHPEMEPPVLLKNDDGSLTLSYDLQSMGRSTTVNHCILTVDAEYHTNLVVTRKHQ